MTITRIVPMSPRVRIAGAEKLTVANLQVQVAPEYSTYLDPTYNGQPRTYCVVNLAVLVTDADGAPVLGLPGSAFHVSRLPRNAAEPWQGMTLIAAAEMTGPPGGWKSGGFYLVQFYPYVEFVDALFGTEIESMVHALTVRGRVRTSTGTAMAAGGSLFTVSRFSILRDAS